MCDVLDAVIIVLSSLLIPRGRQRNHTCGACRACRKHRHCLLIHRQICNVHNNYHSSNHWSSTSAHTTRINFVRAVFKYLSKVITWLRLVRLVIGLKDSRQFFNQWDAKPKPKPIAPCTRDFSRASSELQLIARNCDWFIVLFAPVVIGRSNCFGFGFTTVIWKPL